MTPKELVGRATTVVRGTYYRDGDSLRFDVRVVRVRDGEVMAQLPVIRASIDNVMPALEQLRQSVAGPVHVTLHAHPDPWSTGPSVGLTPAVGTSVDALLVPCWPTSVGTSSLVTAARTATGLPTGAYVTVLPPAEPDLLAQIERFGGNISKTAEFVGMERSALHRKIKSLGL